MHTIEIDDVVYEYLLRKTVRIGESASEILSRLLKVPGPGTNGRGSGESPPPPMRPSGELLGPPAEVSDLLSDPRFQAERDAVGKFLVILSYLYGRDSKGFERVLNLSGRRRKYFGRSSEDLAKYGRSVFPKRIPDSPYWVVTNNDTAKKRQILADAMRLLAYKEAAINAVINALR